MKNNKIIKFFKLAKFQADLFSKDPNKKVCALFIAPDTYQIISTGYNGLPRGIKENQERWNRPEKYKYVVHAETNGIYNSSLNGVSLKNSICIVTMFPCSNCAKALVQVGVVKIYTVEPDLNHTRWGEDYKYSLIILNEALINITYKKDEQNILKKNYEIKKNNKKSCNIL